MLAQLQWVKVMLVLMSLRAVFSKYRELSVSWGLSSLFFLMSAGMPKLTLDMILFLNAEATEWTLYLCVPPLPAAPCHKQCCDLQSHFETVKQPEASSFFLSFASFKEKAGLCVCVQGSLWRIDGGTGFSVWCMFAAERLETPHHPPVLSSPAPPGEK